jgi:hypothetical protein
LPVAQRPLMRQERGNSHEAHRERRQANIRHPVVTVTARPGAPVRQTGADPAQLSDQFPDDAHTAVESRIESHHRRKPPSVGEGRIEIANA